MSRPEVDEADPEADPVAPFPWNWANRGLWWTGGLFDGNWARKQRSRHARYLIRVGETSLALERARETSKFDSYTQELRVKAIEYKKNPRDIVAKSSVRRLLLCRKDSEGRIVMLVTRQIAYDKQRTMLTTVETGADVARNYAMITHTLTR